MYRSDDDDALTAFFAFKCVSMNLLVSPNEMCNRIQIRISIPHRAASQSILYMETASFAIIYKHHLLVLRLRGKQSSSIHSSHSCPLELCLLHHFHASLSYVAECGWLSRLFAMPQRMLYEPCHLFIAVQNRSKIGDSRRSWGSRHKCCQFM